MAGTVDDAKLPPMQRRTLLALGLGSAALFALAGGTYALLKPGLEQGVRLGAEGKAIFRAVAGAVLDGMLPSDPAARAAALGAQLERLDATIAGLSAATRLELSQLLVLLSSVAGRRGLAGVSAPWAEASVADVQAALQSMRGSSFDLRQQAYHALRDLTNGAYFADPQTWSSLGYPGPVVL